MDIKKVIAKLPAGYAEDVAGMSGDQIRAEIIRAETSLKWARQEEKADEKYQGAKELAKDLGAAYREAKAAQSAKIDYSLHVLEERGELGVGAHGVDAEEPKDTRALANKAQGRTSRVA